MSGYNIFMRQTLENYLTASRKDNASWIQIELGLILMFIGKV